MKKHGMFICSCPSCQSRYFAWCDEPTVIVPDARWNRYNNHSIKNPAAARGFVSHGDLLDCGYSLMEVYEAWIYARRAARSEVAA